jgi:hypothetical protein
MPTEATWSVKLIGETGQPAKEAIENSVESTCCVWGRYSSQFLACVVNLLRKRRWHTAQDVVVPTRDCHS